MLKLSPSTLRGYLVHIYTASTLIFVTLAAQWILEGTYRWALAALAVTIIIDATDGALARKWRVKETAAGIDGELLDNIVDFVSYVVVPMLFMLQAQMFIAPMTLWMAFAMFASVFGFSRTTAKLANEGFFVGFPSYWNIVVFYLYLLGTPPIVNTVLVVLLSLSVFVPLRFLYVSRLPKGRTLHLGLGLIWGILCLVALSMDAGTARTFVLYFSLIYPLYYTAHSLQLDLKLRQEQREALADELA